MTTGGALAAAAIGFALGYVAAVLRRRSPQASPPRPSPEFSLTLDLLRRAHGARAVWAVGLEQADAAEIEVRGDDDVAAEHLSRGSALVRLASVDGRTHVAREAGGTYVAVGDFPYGAGLLLEEQRDSADRTNAATEDLRRLVARMRAAESESLAGENAHLAKQVALATSATQTLDGLARAAAELAERLAHRGAVVAIQDPSTRAVHIQAVSQLADKRLLGLSLAPEAPVTRAVNDGLPIVTQGMEDIFGQGVPERRRRDRAGTAYPLFDGRLAVGALVVIGPPVDPDSREAGQINRLVAELGPRLAAARALHEAERRAIRDPLTGLCNLREFERVMQQFRSVNSPGLRAGPAIPATLVYVDLDRFKHLNDTLGHSAGDSALRHAAGVLERQVRDGDLVARIGGEEFAIWLPRTPLSEGREVAERVRRTLEDTPWRWNGRAWPLTASCGVATFPDHVRDLENLRSAADAALYRAKQSGRNRVEMAVALH